MQKISISGLLILLAVHASAQDVSTRDAPSSVVALAAAMDGKWTFVNSGGVKFDGPVSITARADGTGTLKFVGQRCQARDVPMKWTIDRGVVTFKGSLGRCGEGTFIVRKGLAHELEGTFESTLNPTVGEGTLYLDAVK